MRKRWRALKLWGLRGLLRRDLRRLLLLACLDGIGTVNLHVHAGKAHELRGLAFTGPVNEVALYIGSGWNLPEIRVVLLHELVHCVCRPGHGPVFRGVLVGAAYEAWRVPLGSLGGEGPGTCEQVLHPVLARYATERRWVLWHGVARSAGWLRKRLVLHRVPYLSP